MMTNPVTEKREQEAGATRHARRGVICMVLVLLAALCGLCAKRWLSAPHQAAQFCEAERSQLMLKDGLFFQSGQTSPFTGSMVESYAMGSLKSRSAVSNGVLHGVSEGWYTNGQMQVREHFREGISHGLRNKWHETGEKLSEVMIVDGKLHGTFRRWYENGQLAEEIEIHHGKPNGHSRSYYPSGCLRAQASLEHGQLLKQEFWRDGEKRGNSTAALSPESQQL